MAVGGCDNRPSKTYQIKGVTKGEIYSVQEVVTTCPHCGETVVSHSKDLELQGEVTNSELVSLISTLSATVNNLKLVQSKGSVVLPDVEDYSDVFSEGEADLTEADFSFEESITQELCDEFNGEDDDFEALFEAEVVETDEETDEELEELLAEETDTDVEEAYVDDNDLSFDEIDKQIAEAVESGDLDCDCMEVFEDYNTEDALIMATSAIVYSAYGEAVGMYSSTASYRQECATHQMALNKIQKIGKNSPESARLYKLLKRALETEGKLKSIDANFYFDCLGYAIEVQELNEEE